MENITDYQVRGLTPTSNKMLKQISERIGKSYAMKMPVSLGCCLVYRLAVQFFS